MTANTVGMVRHTRSAFSKAGYAGVLLCASLCFGSPGHGQEGRGLTLPDGDAKQLTTLVCSQCHGLRETLLLRDGQKGWEEVVDRMVLYGAQLSPSEAERVTRYLATVLGPGKGLMQGGVSSPHGAPGNGMRTVSLPAGPGKELVAARCVLCHDLGRVVSPMRRKEDWDSLTRNMLRGLKDTPEEIQIMVTYLQTNFSKNTQATGHSQEPPARAINDVFTQKCLLCHSVEPGKDQFGPSLYGEMRGPHPKKTEEQVRTIIRDGKGKMPAFKDILSEKDTDELLAYIRTL